VQLHRSLEQGETSLVEAVMAGLGVRREPCMPLDAGEDAWECCICTCEKQEMGWRCPSRHRYCSDCMGRHIDVVPFPRCPTPSCGYELQETDFEALRVASERLDAFREAKLLNAVDTLGTATSAVGSDAGGGLREPHGEEIVIRCPNSRCGNAVLSLRRDRRRYVCPCGTTPFCTACRQAPYHYHGSCVDVQLLRQRWLDWVSGGREDYHGLARRTETYEGQVLALQEAAARHRELEADEMWKAKQCRLCPKCKRPVQKIDGCDAMLCGANFHGGNKQPGCGEKFNWASAAPYKPLLESESKEPPPQVTAEEARCRGRDVLHAFVDCSLCGSAGRGISGPRFRCLHCPSFDACGTCEPRLAELHAVDHVFEVMFESDFVWGRLPRGTQVRLVRRGIVMPMNLEDISSMRSLEGLRGVVKGLRRQVEAQPSTYQWRTNRGRWRDYTAADSATIAAAAVRGQRQVGLRQGATRYVVDLKKMRQINMTTKGTRPVRQSSGQADLRVPAVEISSEPAACRIELDEGGEVIVPASHLEPILASRSDAESLMARAWTVQEEGEPESPVGDLIEEEAQDSDEEDGDDEEDG